MMKIPRVDAAIAQAFMEGHHLWFVLRTNGANRNRRAVAGGPSFNPCRRIRADARPWKMAIGNRPIVKHDAGVKGENSGRRGEQRIDVYFLDAWGLRDKLAEADEKLFECGTVDGRASADAGKGLVDA